MSSYGTPPPNPYGQQPGQPYGQQPGQPYGNPYGAQPGYGGAPGGLDYAHWISRVGASVIDMLAASVAGLPLFIGYGILLAGFETDPVTGEITRGDASPVGFALVALGLATYLAFWVWNVCLRQGKTGYTIGKSVLEIKLIKESDQQPVGAGTAFGRALCHVLDGFCYIGYLWPLWDPKRQTFADKIVSSVVIRQPK